MRTVDLPTQAELNELLRYDSDTGKLYWKFRGRKYFTCDGDFKKWNTRYADQLAMMSNVLGYPSGKIFGRMFRAHRVIWKMVHGSEPICIDHINGRRDDNRIGNLRSVTQLENCRNRKLHKDNKTGFCGVKFQHGRYYATGGLNYEKVALGSFLTKQEAIAARIAFNKAAGFHENHGRAA